MDNEITEIYQAPDIRKQTLEQAQEFIEAKRVRRLVLATTFQEKQHAKTTKLYNKDMERFVKQSALFERAADKLTADIEKLADRLTMLNELHSTLINVEGVLNAETI